MSGANGVNGHTNGDANGDHLPALCTSAQDFLKHKFDYVVVGGGTAGLVVAARLTENPDVTVGVLEAGKNRLGDPLVDSPAAFMQMFNNPEYDWRIHTVPQVGGWFRAIEVMNLMSDDEIEIQPRSCPPHPAW